MVDTKDHDLSYIGNSIYLRNDGTMELDKKRNLMYVTNRKDRCLEVIDLETCEVKTKLKLNFYPSFIAMNTGLDKICLAGFSSQLIGNPWICVIDCGTYQISNNIFPPTDSLAKSIWYNPPSFLKMVANPDKQRIFVPYVQSTIGLWYRKHGKIHDGVFIIDISTSVILKKLILRDGSNDICIDSKTNRVLWINSFNKNIEIQVADQVISL
jgi:hypothetical protein